MEQKLFRESTLLLSGLLLISLFVSCRPVNSQTVPAGFKPLATADLSVQPNDEEILAEFMVPKTAEISIFYTIPNIDATYFDLSLRGPDGDNHLILHSEGYRTDENGSGQWEKSLLKGDYQLLLSAPQTSGTLSVYWK